MSSNDLVRKFENLRALLGARVFRLFLLSGVVGLLWFGCETFFIYVFQAYLSSLGLLTTSQTWVPDWFPKGVWPAVGLLILFGTARALLFAWKTILTQISTAVFMKTQRESLLAFFLQKPPQIKTSEIAYIFSDVVQQAGTVVGYLSSGLMVGSSAVLYFIFLVKLAWVEALVGVSLLAIVVLPISLIGKKLVVLSQRVISENLAINEYLLMGLRHWTFLKVHRTLDSQISRGSQSLFQVQKDHQLFAKLLGLNAALPLFLGILIISTISLVSVEITKTDTMTLVGFFYIFLRLAQSGSEANSLYGHVRMNWVGITTLYHWHQLRAQRFSEQRAPELPKIERDSIATELENNGATLIFDKVSFSWKHGQAPVFRDVSFNLVRGDIFLIRGPSGSGKSSLLSVILGLNEPEIGSVKICGLRPAVFFDHFADDCAYVGPEPVLVPGTIRENLVFGLNESTKISNSEMNEVLNDVGMDQFVDARPQGLDTALSERTELSTGQKQRLALSRMLLRKPKLLILDEVTANLDPGNNKRIIEIIQRNSKEMTVIVVSHRDGFEDIATKRLDLVSFADRT